MNKPTINAFFDHQGHHYEDDYIHEPFKDLSHTCDPLHSLPDPLISDITVPLPSDLGIAAFRALMGEVLSALENFPPEDCSPDQPTNSPTSPQVPTEAIPGLAPVTTSLTIPATSSLSPLPSSAFSSPTATYTAMSVSPPAQKRCHSLVDEPNQSQGPIPGPSTTRRIKRPRPSYEGESSFQLAGPIPPPEPSIPADKPRGKRRTKKPWSSCRCPDGPSQKPTRHWDASCPYNPNAGEKRYPCEECDETFSTKWNKDRHVEQKHY